MTKRSVRRATTLDRFATGLTGIGALRGLAGLFSFSLVSTLFGKSLLARIVYTLVGLSGVYLLFASLQES